MRPQTKDPVIGKPVRPVAAEQRVNGPAATATKRHVSSTARSGTGMDRLTRCDMRVCACGAPMGGTSARRRACYNKAGAKDRCEGSGGPMIVSPWETLPDGTRRRFVCAARSSRISAGAR
jgi:hypothetical protein